MNQKIANCKYHYLGGWPHLCVFIREYVRDCSMIVGTVRVHTYQHGMVTYSRWVFHTDTVLTRLLISSYHDHTVLWVCLNTIVLSAIVGWQKVTLPSCSYSCHSNRQQNCDCQAAAQSAYPILLWLLDNRPCTRLDPTRWAPNIIMVARQQTMYQIGSNQKQSRSHLWLLSNRPVPVDYLDQPDQPNQSGEIGSTISYLDTLAY